MTYSIDDIQIGDTVEVRSGFGHGPFLTGIVDEVCEDVKNGIPGIDYKVEGSNGYDGMHWAYIDQVVRVHRPAKA